MSPTRILPSVLALFFYLPQASYAFYWGYYPACAQPQLAANAPAACNSVTTGVGCLCADATFLSASMKDIWRNCGCAVLQNSAQTASTICTDSGVPIALTEAQMVSAGDGGLSSCTDPPGLSSTTVSTATSSPTTTATANGGSGNKTGGGGGSGLSATGQIVLGVVTPVVSIIIAILAWRCPKRDRKLRPTEVLRPYVSSRPPFLHRRADRVPSDGVIAPFRPVPERPVRDVLPV